MHSWFNRTTEHSCHDHWADTGGPTPSSRKKRKVPEVTVDDDSDIEELPTEWLKSHEAPRTLFGDPPPEVEGANSASSGLNPAVGEMFD